MLSIGSSSYGMPSYPSGLSAHTQSVLHVLRRGYAQDWLTIVSVRPRSLTHPVGGRRTFPRRLLRWGLAGSSKARSADALRHPGVFSGESLTDHSPYLLSIGGWRSGGAGMGTSTRWLGPRGAGWETMRRGVERLQPLPSGISDDGPRVDSPGSGNAAPAATTAMAQSRDACLSGLRRAVQREPDALGLRPAMTAAGERLVDVAEELAEAGIDEFLGARHSNISREDRFVAEFVRRVGGTGGLVADAVVRRSATRTAATLLREHAPLRRELREGAAGGRLDPDWLCVIWKLFFADIVETVVAAVIAEQVHLAVPALAVVDPTQAVPEWVAEKLIKALPSPCDEGRRDSSRSLTAAARDWLEDTVEEALGSGSPDAGA